MKRATWASVAMAGLVLIAGLPVRAADTADRIVAIVGGEPVMRSDIDRHYGDVPQTPQQLRQALNDLIESRLLSQAARKEGFRDQITEAEIDEQIALRAQQEGATLEQFHAELKKLGFSVESYRKLVGDKIAQHKLLERKILPLVAVPPEDVAKHYKEHLDDYRVPERLRIRMVSVFLRNFKFDDPGRQREAARKEIDQVVEKLNDKQDIQYLAKKHSQDAYAANGGDWGWVARDTLQPVFAEKAFAMKVGEISDVIATGDSFHVLKVEAREAPHLKSFEEVQEEIRSELSRRRQEALRQDLVRRLWDKTCVELFAAGR